MPVSLPLIRLLTLWYITAGMLSRRDLFKLFALAPLAPLALKLKASPPAEPLPAPIPLQINRDNSRLYRTEEICDVNGFVVAHVVIPADSDIEAGVCYQGDLLTVNYHSGKIVTLH